MNQDTLLLIFYINVKHLDATDVVKYINEEDEYLREKCEGARYFIIPVEDSETRVECINPKYLSKEEWQSIRDKVDRIKSSLDMK